MRVNPDDFRKLQDAVITRVEATETRVAIVASGPAGSVTLLLTGCEWNDSRCESCTCQKDRVRVEIA